MSVEVFYRYDRAGRTSTVTVRVKLSFWVRERDSGWGGVESKVEDNDRHRGERLEISSWSVLKTLQCFEWVRPCLEGVTVPLAFEPIDSKTKQSSARRNFQPAKWTWIHWLGVLNRRLGGGRLP